MSNIATPPYTLGLDIGMASVGAALLTGDRILALHVRAFDKAETAKEGESLNKIRRDSRLTRRRIRRRAHRLLRLRRLFKREGIVTDTQPETFVQQDISPWELRAEGLDRKLSPEEWAATLYHIVKHRGFQSNRKSEAKADEKAGQMLSGVTRNQALMKEKGWRTVGEMAAKDFSFEEAKRNKGGDYSHTFARKDLSDELSLLFTQQRNFSNPHASESIEQQVHKMLMARKPTLSGENLLKMVGKCTFEKSEFRAPKASYRAERFVWLGKLNNLKISFSGETRPLHDYERTALIDLPFTQSKLTFKQVRKALDLPEHARFNLVSYRFDSKGKDPEDITFFEAKHFHEIRKAYESAGLKTKWQRDAIDADRLDLIGYATTCFKDDKEARDYLTTSGVEPEIIEAVLNISFEKFIQLSQKALKHILPYLEKGLRYDEAVKEAGYHHSQPQETNQRSLYLPAPDKNVIINPVVYRALNQARKLVNAIIKEYGPPAVINIELARDLSKPFDERRKIEKAQKAFQDEKESVKKDFRSMFNTDPSGIDLQKWRLYREQNAQCAYSQKAIDLNRLHEAGYVEIDHALPYSRSFDDSQNNKVLVLTAENRNKGNRTPFEYLGGANNSERWQRFEAWVNSTKTIRQAKRNRLLRRNFGGEEAESFRDRNLNDTRYICREFKKMMETHLQWHPQSEGKERCVVVAGQLTALLRVRWGLIKERANGDLHHALDAAVIAAADRKMVRRMAEYSKRKELAQMRDLTYDPETGELLDIDQIRKLEEHFPTPWPHFRRELLAKLSPNPAQAMDGLAEEEPGIRPVRVSRAPTRRGLGSAHQETIRSIGKEGKLLQEGLSAIKTPIENLKLKDLESIVGYERDTQLISVLRERLEKFGDDGKKAFTEPVFKPSKEGKIAPRIRSVKLLATQKSGIPIRQGIANNGSMLRVDIFTKAGKFHAVPIYVADSVRDVLPNKAVVASKLEEEWTVIDASYQFLFSLYPNDWIRIIYKDSPIREGYYSGLDRATGNIDLWLHDRNQNIGAKGLLRGNGIKTVKSVEKYHVDYLGNLHKVHHEERKPLRKGQKVGD